jgi:hypothetical protein
MGTNTKGIAIIPNDPSRPVVFVLSEVQSIAEQVAIRKGLSNKDYVLSNAIMVTPNNNPRDK